MMGGIVGGYTWAHGPPHAQVIIFFSNFVIDLSPLINFVNETYQRIYQKMSHYQRACYAKFITIANKK